MKVTLYESGTTRSARCRWTLLEAGIPFESVSRKGLIGSDEVKSLHPLGKLPVTLIDGKALFESSAVCTYIADHAPEADLIAKPGSWARGEHDQWVSYALTEMEAWLWNSAVNTFVLPKSERVTAGFEQNALMFKRSANFLNKFLLGSSDLQLIILHYCKFLFYHHYSIHRL